MGKACSGNPRHGGSNSWPGVVGQAGTSQMGSAACCPPPCQPRWLAVPAQRLTMSPGCFWLKQRGLDSNPVQCSSETETWATSPAVACEWNGSPCAIGLLTLQISLCPKEEFNAYLAEKMQFYFLLNFPGSRNSQQSLSETSQAGRYCCNKVKAFQVHHFHVLLVV